MKYAFVLFLGIVASSCGCATSPPTPPPKLTQAHRAAISAALRSDGLPSPQSIEINDSSYLVATFELSGPVNETSLHSFAEKAVINIRNAMQPTGIVKSYRVTINGPSPGPGLIRRYGNARFHEGGSVQWEPAR